MREGSLMDAVIIGLAHTGKTTLLSALAGTEISSKGFATVHVHDERLNNLADIFERKRRVFAEIRLREAAWPGVGKPGRKTEMERYLTTISGSRLFLHVVAAAQTLMMPGPPDPAKDLVKLDGEMIFADLLAIERILERSRKAPLDANVKTLLKRLKGVLEDDRPLWSEPINALEKGLLSGFNLATLAEQLIVVNTAEDAPGPFDPSVFGDRLFGRRVMSMCFPVAKEISLLPLEDQEEFAAEMGLSGTAANRVAREAFAQLDLLSFFTVGDEECRAWPVKRGTSALQAAGEVHSDIQRGFIRAEVVNFEEFIKRKSMKACREDGVLRLEGKGYVVAEADIIQFRFNI